MKEEKYRERLAALLGIQVPPEPTPEEIRENESKSREAEAVIAFVENPNGFKERDCNNCGKQFAVNRANVAYCSDHCRKVALESKGLRWNPEKTPEERWGVNEPLTVSPQAYEAVKALAG